jgi:cation diffusion facilitator CzcD-associated flavoprotein CzcO
MFQAPEVGVAIVGAGFSGLGMAIRLRQAGEEDFLVLERADDVGGTWRDNTYPGVQCDVPSKLYSFSFAPNPDWSRTFSRGGEIQAYLRRCVDDFGLRPRLRLGCAVTAAAWEQDAARWRLETSHGPLSARILVAGQGPLTEPASPDIPGLEDFPGPVWHSARWDHDVDLDGRRVAVVGTGASAIQFVPRIARRTAALHVFQRTPPWILPHPDRPISRVEQLAHRHVPGLGRLAREAMYWGREWFVVGFRHEPVMRIPELIARAHLRRQVGDPALRARLRPDYRLGCKRILLSNDYYPALQRPGVELVTAGIEGVEGRSVLTADGRSRDVDAIVLGTGFNVSEPPAVHMLRGRDGVLLCDVWARTGMQAHLGTSIGGFPNLFMLIGPNTGLGHSSMVVMIESQLDYVMDALRTMRARRLDAVEVRPEVVRDYNAALQADMRGTVWTSGGCVSWYLDEHGRNTTLWPRSTWAFRRATRHFDPAAHMLRPAAARAPVAA